MVKRWKYYSKHTKRNLKTNKKHAYISNNYYTFNLNNSIYIYLQIRKLYQY